MKEYLIEKYEGYIANLEWHLNNNSEYMGDADRKVTLARLGAYNEILTDLKML